MNRTPKLVVAASLALALAACSTGGTGEEGDNSTPAVTESDTVIDLNITRTEGPNGEVPTSVDELTLTDDEVASIKKGNHKAALLWHTSSAWVTAVQAGAEAEFDRLGVEIVATADAAFDAAKQADQVQTALVKKPDVIISLPVDSTTGASAFQPAVDAGVNLIFVDNAPDGFAQGEQYGSIVTGDLFELGRQAAMALGEAMGGKGEAGILFYDAHFYVTNQRDGAFKQTLTKEFPDIKIVAQQGFTDPNAAESIASAMLTQNPDLGGIYTSWAEPAQGVLAALRTANNTTTKIVTLDLDDTVAVDMVSGGQTAAIVADKAWELGRGLARAAALKMLGKEAPAFAVVGALTVTKENVAQGYEESMHEELPSAVAAALN